MDLLFAFSMLLSVTAVFGVINERYLRLEPSIGLMLLALLAAFALAGLRLMGWADALDGVLSMVAQFNLSEVLLNGVLCFMLFAGSAGVQVADLRENRAVIVFLAFGSTLIACGVTGLLLSWGLGLLGIDLPLGYALVFGALISPTDPIAALAILQAVGLPKPLETIISGESLFNDGVGVVLFTLALTQVSGAPEESSALGLFLREVLGGVGLGLLTGLVMHVLLFRTKTYANQLLVTLGAVSLGYSVALQIDVSGPIAMVVAGLVVGNVTWPRLADDVKAPLSAFWGGIESVLNSLLFVMMGLVVVTVHSLASAPLLKLLPVAILACLVARAVSVYIPIAVLDRTPALNADRFGLTKLLTWGGLRGGLALALALSLPESEIKPLITNMTFAVVAFSVLVQGSTISKLFKPEYLKTLLHTD
ncbi:MAG: cation:proton antiporter [Deltaproteobacteria bacterium]|nr:cation:proton antiporter [Deltaproteobacteria bacterium]MBT8463296.1 cation:proton antiporter [Deltaproteobacteria bacterium]NNK41376.1 sodium:proton antiporter [Myxococcales bacterium]